MVEWVFSDRLLPSHRAIPAPFTHEECQELRKMLDTISNGMCLLALMVEWIVADKGMRNR